MTIHIREATKEDYLDLLPIASESQAQHVEAHPDRFQRGVAGLPEDYFFGLLEDEASTVYVAEFDKHIAGSACVNMSPLSPLKYDLNSFAVWSRSYKSGSQNDK